MMAKAKALSLLNGLTRLARPCNRIQNTLYTIIQYICIFQTTRFPDTNANTSEIPALNGLGCFGSIMVGDIFNFAKHFAQFASPSSLELADPPINPLIWGKPVY